LAKESALIPIVMNLRRYKNEITTNIEYIIDIEEQYAKSLLSLSNPWGRETPYN
jgi:hypothetical protein